MMKKRIKIMNKNEIYIKSGTRYREMTKELLVQCGLAALIADTDMRIGIKPNLVSASEASWGATTHPEVVAGIIEYLQEHGFRNLSIMEGSWVGDKTTEAYEVCGYRGAFREISGAFPGYAEGKRHSA